MISLFGKNEPEPTFLDKLKKSVSKTKAALSETVDTIFLGERKIDPQKTRNGAALDRPRRQAHSRNPRRRPRKNGPRRSLGRRSAQARNQVAHSSHSNLLRQT